MSTVKPAMQIDAGEVQTDEENNTMIIDREMLRRFNACSEQADIFEQTFPEGLDVSGLWGTVEERATTWLRLLQSEVVKRNLGWAIWEGLIPSRITADLSWADMSWANMSGADMSGADLRGAAWDKNTRWPEGFVLASDEA